MSKRSNAAIVKPGSFFAVPSKYGGFGVGLLARRKSSFCLGYFFNVWFDELPINLDASNIASQKVILVASFGAMGLNLGEWPILKSDFVFDPQRWPIPIFSGRDLLTGRYYASEYNEDLTFKRRFEISESGSRKYFEDGGFGDQALAAQLDKIRSALQTL